MIKIDFAEPTDERWKRWRKGCEAETQVLIRHHEHGEGTVVEPEASLYARRSIKKNYYCTNKGERFAPFYGKCVFCEIRKDILHTEHFRPKKSVRDSEGRPIERERPDGTRVAHPGYYWLAYEWHNLLLACDDCNNGYKRNQFPLVDEDVRAWRSTDDLSVERPLLINPLVEEPTEHLAVDLHTGLLTHLTDRGSVTIEVLGLNRDSLLEQRHNVIKSIESQWMKATSSLTRPEEQVEARSFLQQSRQGINGFTLTARTVINRLLDNSRSLSER